MYDLFAGVALLAMSHFVQGDKAEVPPEEQIRILPVAKTPESNTVILTISVPKKGQIVPEGPLWIQFRIDGYALGADSQFDRRDEVANSSMGQTVHVVIDNRPYLSINEPAIDPFNEEGYFYDTSYKFEVPFELDRGMHSIRMFPARSFGESLKGENTFHAISFYIGEEINDPQMDLSQPYLTYNEPSNQIPLTEGRAVLLDFYITHCTLTPDGYKVLLTIDEKIKRTLTSWQPYYIYGLKQGKHSIRLELIDAEGKKVPGVFNDVERTIQIQG